MNIFRQICKKNWYIIAATTLLAVCTEVLCGIMLYDYIIYEDGVFGFCLGIVLRFIKLAAAVLIVFFSGTFLNSKHSLAVSLVLTALVLFYSDFTLNEIIPIEYDFAAFCLIMAMVFLAFYFVNQCLNSIKNTVWYMLVLILICLFTYEEAEFYTVLAIHIFLVISNRKSYDKKSVRILNFVSLAASSTAFAGVLVNQIVKEDFYRYPKEEITVNLIKKVMTNLKPFGKSEFFDEFISAGRDYNILKFFSCYGYVIGIVAVVIFILFVASIIFSCIRSRGELKLAAHIAAITLIVRTLIAVIEVSGAIMVFESDLIVGSLNSGEYTAIGIIIGLIFAAERTRKTNRILT